MRRARTPAVLLGLLLAIGLLVRPIPLEEMPAVAAPAPPPPRSPVTSMAVPDPQVGERSPTCLPHRSLLEPGRDPVPDRLQAVLAERRADPRFEEVQLGLSVWMEGYGEIGVHQPDLPLLPASNQKLLTAMAALSLLDQEAELVTEVRGGGPVENGTLHGDLVLVGGGDPTLRSTGPHSLEELARRVRETGLVTVRGRLLVDETRYDDRRTAEGWLDWQVPAYVGPLSALTVDGNRYRSDPDFLADPALGNGRLLGEILARHGVTVEGEVVGGSAPGTLLASLPSPPIGELVVRMLSESDNAVAELLVKEMGLVARGEGSTEAGLEMALRALSELCVPLRGSAADGSGLSRHNLRSARAWRMLLQAAQAAPWWDELVGALPVAGETGTLAGRFRATAAHGNLRAKTGSIIVGRALSGTFTTPDGRPTFFSVLTNGDRPAGSEGAIDDLVAELAAYQP